MKNIRHKLSAIIITTLLFCCGCKNDFDPVVVGSYDKLVVFLVMDNREESQIAYIQKVYQNQNEKKDIKGIELLLSETEGNSFKFRDTSIQNDYFRTYCTNNIKLSRGSVYQLTIIKDSVIEDKASIQFPNFPLSGGSIYYVKNKKEQYPAKGKIYFDKCFLSSKDNFYYKFKAFIEYEFNENNATAKCYREIPYGVIFDENKPSGGRNRPSWDIPLGTLIAEGSSEYTKTKIDSFTFEGLSIIYALQLFEPNQRNAITINRAFVVVYTADEYFYDNFMEVKWEEIISTRFDLRTSFPNIFSKSEKIMGVFGALSTDTINIPIDPEVIDLWGYKNGQKTY